MKITWPTHLRPWLVCRGAGEGIHINIYPPVRCGDGVAQSISEELLFSTSFFQLPLRLHSGGKVLEGSAMKPIWQSQFPYLEITLHLYVTHNIYNTSDCQVSRSMDQTILNGSFNNNMTRELMVSPYSQDYLPRQIFQCILKFTVFYEGRIMYIFTVLPRNRTMG